MMLSEPGVASAPSRMSGHRGHCTKPDAVGKHPAAATAERQVQAGLPREHHRRQTHPACQHCMSIQPGRAAKALSWKQLRLQRLSGILILGRTGDRGRRQISVRQPARPSRLAHSSGGGSSGQRRLRCTCPPHVQAGSAPGRAGIASGLAIKADREAQASVSDMRHCRLGINPTGATGP